MRQPVPLRRRPGDLVPLVFFFVNFFFITYIVDFEQLVVPDPMSFSYPLWPPAPLVDLVHWWGRNFDPVLMARPPWWKATIWIDAILFGPFYALAIYAFIRGRDWIRVPTLIWGSMLITNVTIIMSEELFGVHATPSPLIVTLANAPWVIFPLLLMIKMARNPHPFTEDGTRS